MDPYGITSEVSEGWGREPDEEDQTEDPKEKLSDLRLTNFVASLFATVLEDILIELRILEESSSETRVQKILTDMPLLLALKYGVEQPQVKDELEGIDHHNLGCIEYKLNKLLSDRLLISNVLMSTYAALSLDNIFTPLICQVKEIIDLDEYRDLLQQEETNNKALRRDLNKQLRQQRNHFKSVMYDTDVNIDTLKSKVEDAAWDAEMRSRYIGNWQRARTEQHLQTIEDKEAQPSNAIEYFKNRMDHEQRVHGEVELLTNIIINETLEKIEFWMNKYDKDIEDIDLKIQIKKNEYQDIVSRREKLEETIEKHDKLMKDWVEFKEERERQRQYREKMTTSAIIVQAWWRGLMVRLQLGPYKKKKKKKKEKEN